MRECVRRGNKSDQREISLCKSAEECIQCSSKII